VGRAVSDKGRTIRLPVHIGEKIRKVGRVTSDLSIELGRKPTEDEVVERLGWTAEQVREMKGTIPDAASLNKPVSSEDEALRLEDFIVDETHLDVPDAVIEEIEATWLKEAIGLSLRSSSCRESGSGSSSAKASSCSSLGLGGSLTAPSRADRRSRRFWHEGIYSQAA
jgi:DNA-directed RNA polymerase sigma subunit (sigma70/sigma32)